jgi:predicted esterase
MRIARLPLILLVALCCASAAAGSEHATIFSAPKGGWPEHPDHGTLRRTVSGIDDPSCYYLLYVPADYDAKKAYPLWMVLHGSHAEPKDMASVFGNGLVQRGAISVYPNALDRHQQMLEWNYPDSGKWMLTVLRDVASTYHLDARQLYLAGHSMGGGGTWTMGAVMSDLWAGIAPLSGWYLSSPKPDPRWFGALPMYIISGDQDQNVLVENSRRAVRDLAALGRATKTLTARPESADFGSSDIIYRELPGVGHNIFMPWQDLGAPEIGRLVAWLSAHKRAAPGNFDAACARLVEWGKVFNWKPDGPFGTFGK